MENNNRAIFYVNSSHGTLTVDADTGDVISHENFEGGDGLGGIKRFNVDEFKDYYNVRMINGDQDILNFGYWELINGILTYVEPAQDWRDEGMGRFIENNVIPNAINAFWKYVAERMPMCKTGDLAHDLTVNFHEECEKVIRAWYNTNKPSPRKEIKRQAAQAPAVVSLLEKALDELKKFRGPNNPPDWLIDAEKIFLKEK